jgi:hypothetical protein
VYGSAVRGLVDHLRYNGKDDKGKVIYDYNKILPVINFTGRVKIHGTNAGVCFDITTGDMWVQSRERIITIPDDNKGFACYVEKNKVVFKELFSLLVKAYDLTEGVVSIYGEWCGKGITGGVGVSQLEKMFVIFGVKHTINPLDENEKETNWFDFYVEKYHDIRMFHIDYFGTYNIEVDLNDPKLSQNELIDITNEIERECPVAKKLGATSENGSIIGEGAVWSSNINGNMFRFKVKGEKHSGSKVKCLAPIDPEKLASVKEFVDYAVTENRLEQGIRDIFEANNITPDVSNTGKFLKWVVTDVMKEEVDTLIASGLIVKDVTSAISNKGRKWFFDKYINL